MLLISFPYHNQGLKDKGSHLKVQKCLVHTTLNKTKLGGKVFIFCSVIFTVLKFHII